MAAGLGKLQNFTRETYGQAEYNSAVKDYEQYAGKYSDLISSAADTTQTAIGEASELRDYYKADGGYGKGQKTQASETVRGGEAKALGSSVAAGMSSQFGARGINVLASAELAKLYQGIDDTRNQLLIQAFTPYAQMIQTLGTLTSAGAQIASAAPKASDYIQYGDKQFTGYSDFIL